MLPPAVVHCKNKLRQDCSSLCFRLWNVGMYSRKSASDARQRLHILKCSCLRSINGSLFPDSTTDHQWLLKINQKDASWYFCFYKCWKTKSLVKLALLTGGPRGRCSRFGDHPNLITSRYKWTKKLRLQYVKTKQTTKQGVMSRGCVHLLCTVCGLNPAQSFVHALLHSHDLKMNLMCLHVLMFLCPKSVSPPVVCSCAL